MAHIKDLNSHIVSIAEDAEYWRAKRLEPRVFRMIRKGEITFHDLLDAASSPKSFGTPVAAGGSGKSLEERVAALEFRLGDFMKGINVASVIGGNRVLVEESREEAGTYDPSLRFEHRPLSGSDEERVGRLEILLEEDMELLGTLFRVFVKKGVIREERLEEMLAATVLPRYENGARVVARAWTDPAFKARLISDAKGTLRELGFGLNRTPKLVVVEDSDSVHNVIVCTLCSCYPYEILGNAPWWYKNDDYKQAVVKDPRGTLRERFKFSVPESVDILVYDSTSDIRYMVLPARPKGTEGMPEETLAQLVTEESLIGVGGVKQSGIRAEANA